jgi:hypothetical protein
MAIFIEELALYLAAQLGGSWSGGTNVFYDALPEETHYPLPQIALYDAGGESADLITDIFTPFHRLLSRAEDVNQARQNWESAFNVLNRLTGETLTNYFVAFIESIDSSPKIIRNEQKDIVLESWFRIRYKHIA